MKPETKKIDPRAARTRILIQDAFLSLTREKVFEAITVKDIVEKANINRSTFYAHFEDKYILLDQLLSEAFSSGISSKFQSDVQLNEDTLKTLIVAMCNYHENISNHCNMVYKSISSYMDNKTQLKLKELIALMLTNTTSFGVIEQENLDLLSIMISNSIYGATSYWYSQGKHVSAKELSHNILPYVMPSIEMLSSKR
ncbi:TetR/AcrR family transcriptional regulator [Clostridium folliculivorans]|uniref:TetR/AcrR family transcriptional regulator n=1 Tax=Clostridium folliculivorans TaxID=2886038 RepID=A0A9W6D9R3_9CLOT|nr:TetR/AcrR family transcriptional regulator [Clostridium folliculivorans]GKU24404.1 TetR/AcrR family transcriptional regulator [Clostridium folliculivorans]GKU30500.1 TetR/AcrR family transcriptional regulator [Clostridium folliculivorans]